MEALVGIWRLISSKGWDEAGNELPSPYGRDPVGQISFSAQGRMLAALCNGDPDVSGARAYSSYGGAFRFDGATLTVAVDIASDPTRVGGRQVREVSISGNRMVLRPPLRAYGGAREQRELEWERIWTPGA